MAGHLERRNTSPEGGGRGITSQVDQGACGQAPRLSIDGTAALRIGIPRLVIGGATSGVGKTTIVAGLIGALVRRGLRVAPFKVGPDYIDPSYHARLAGRPCRNLDSWMVPASALAELFARATADADIAVVEGVMGLYDGRTGSSDEGSTAEVAKLLGAPVVLVADAAKAARSVGALVLGYRAFDPSLDLRGAILNRIAGPTHWAWCRDAVVGGGGVAAFGYLPRRPDLVLPERHLGLVPTGESAPDDGFFDRLVAQVEETIDVVGLIDLARSAGPLAVKATGLFPQPPAASRVRIGVALDPAFTFYYQDNFDLLRASGAEIVPFSPLSDTSLPVGVRGLYIGGGFPELHAGALAANRPLLSAIRDAVADGMPTVAECGGLMYLGEGIVDLEGRRHRLVGAVPGWSVMSKRHLTLGYRTATALADGPLVSAGEVVRGHEFHWSEQAQPIDETRAAWRVAESEEVEGYARGNLLASYLHIHFASRPDLAPRFVASCLRW